MILGLVDEAVSSGARQSKVCELLKIDARTLQRWRTRAIGDDERAGPRQAPKNKLTQEERERVLEVINMPEYRDLSPQQIVPILAEKDIYLASESTIYRILRQEGQAKHREPYAEPKKRYRPTAYMANGPNEVWSWDITYLKTTIRGVFYYVYMIVDVWSRKIVGWSVHDQELSEFAAELADETYKREGVESEALVLHSDNGGPMKGATMLGTLQKLGVAASFSRPRVSDDNPYSEALFRTLKYRPDFPRQPFKSLDAAIAWVEHFVWWYNKKHRHSAIRFVTPEQRHQRRDSAILRRRHRVYTKARKQHPERWTGQSRNWTQVEFVWLNPEPDSLIHEAA